LQQKRADGTHPNVTPSGAPVAGGLDTDAGYRGYGGVAGELDIARAPLTCKYPESAAGMRACRRTRRAGC